MKPIETHYGGCRFRSRLEARYAVFFDTLGIAWEYEPQGYALPSGTYLPDFYLPKIYPRSCRNDSGVWFEVKPEHCKDPRWSELAEATTTVYVGFGLPRPPLDSGQEWIEEWSGPGWDNCMVFCDCWDDVWTMQYGPESNYHRSKDHPLIDRGLQAARSARFEHGEAG